MGLTSASFAQYCTPRCSNPTGGCTYGPVTRFQVNGASSTLLDTLGCDNSGAEDRTGVTSITCTLNAGGSYTFNATSPYASPKNMQIWIDFNNDSTFSSSESVGGANSWGMSVTDSFIIPAGVSAGVRRMRYVSEYGGTIRYPSINPCMGTGYMFGDARDYMVTIGTGSSSSGCTGTPSAGTAAATSSSSCGYTSITLTDATASTGSGITYQWQSSTDGGTTWSAMTGATATSTTVAEPTTNTLYRLVVTCTTSGMSATSATASYTVDKISGHIFFAGTAPDTVSLQVWLIDYNASAGTLIAVDSTMTCLDSLMAYYQFTGVRAGTYKVKAKSMDVTSSMVGSTGYIPTYGSSSAHWSTGTNTTHTSSAAHTQNITMILGTVTSGPGFIGGSITSGAGKGTAGDIPAANMLVYLKNATTGVITQTYTNASGAYSFGSIALGTYYIYPEMMAYTTTPSATITLTASTTSMTSINFRQYNDTKRILPVTTNIGGVVANNAASFTIYPNPASNTISLSWDGALQGVSNVTITDVAGREVYSFQVSVATTQGSSMHTLPVLADGMYIVRIAQNGSVYNSKLTVQH